MKHKRHMQKVVIFSLTSLFSSGWSDHSHLYAELEIAQKVSIPVASIYSSQNEEKIDLNLHKNLCQKAIEQKNKFLGQNVLTVSIKGNKGNQGGKEKFFTFISGIAPKKGLKEGEIDAVKLFGCDDIRIHLTKQKATKKAFQTYLAAIHKYINFLKTRFNGIWRQDIDILQFEIKQKQKELKGKIKSKFSTFFKNFFRDIRNFPFKSKSNHSHFKDIFHTEMLLLYAIEKGIKVDGFNFKKLNNQDLNICSYNDMCFNCEYLLAKFTDSKKRTGKKVIVSSVNPYVHPTRQKDMQFPKFSFLPHFIKIAFANMPESDS